MHVVTVLINTDDYIGLRWLKVNFSNECTRPILANVQNFTYKLFISLL